MTLAEKSATLKASPSSISLAVAGEDGVEQLVANLKPQDGDLHETFFVHYGGEVSKGIKTGRAALVMIAGNWPEMLKAFDSAVVKVVGDQTVPMMVDGATPESIFLAAVARVCGDAVSEDWFQKPEHYDLALSQTPEVQHLLNPKTLEGGED